MRLEQVAAKALERYDFDRYLLARAVGKRAEELTKGAEPLVDMDIKQNKASDIAILEIAKGELEIIKEK